MILTSQTKTFGFWFTVLTIFFSFGCLLASPFMLSEVPVPGMIFSYFVFVVAGALAGKVIWDNNKVIIDTELRTIVFISRFTRKSHTHSFDDFDGYVLIDEPAGGYSNSLYLVKNKILVHKMTSFIYSNYKELKAGLNSVPFISKLPFSHWRSLKIALRYPVLK